MKKLLYILALLVLVGCQTIPADEQLTEVDKESIRSNRTTLICEFSGYLCTNCPNAAEEAHNLLGVWGKNLVVVEMHPASNSFTRYTNEKYNYTCDAADIYYKAFGGLPTTGLPTGVINLNGSFTEYPLWGGAYIGSAVQQSTIAMSATTEYDAATRTLSASVTLDNLDQKEQDLRLVAWLTEDRIVGAQKMPDGSSRTDYEHNHLLRDTLTQAWGEPIKLQASRTHALVPYIISDRCVAENCNLVVLAMRDEEVVQAVQVPVINL